MLSGEGAGREFAAYLLDASYGGFAGVPATMMVEACHPAFCSRGQIEVGFSYGIPRLSRVCSVSVCVP